MLWLISELSLKSVSFEVINIFVEESIEVSVDISLSVVGNWEVSFIYSLEWEINSVLYSFIFSFVGVELSNNAFSLYEFVFNSEEKLGEVLLLIS